MSEIEDFISRFPQELRNHCFTNNLTLDTLKHALDTIKSIPDTQLTGRSSSDRLHERQEALEQAIREYIASQIGKIFPRIDPKFFTYRRWIKIAFAGGHPTIAEDQITEPKQKKNREDGISVRWINCNLLAASSLVDEGSFRSGNLRNNLTLGNIRYPGGRPNHRLSVFTKFPKDNINHRQLLLGDEAIAECHAALANLWRVPAAAEILREFYFRPASLDAYWIPYPEDLFLSRQSERDPVDQSPILVLRVVDCSFLAAIGDGEKNTTIAEILRKITEETKVPI